MPEQPARDIAKGIGVVSELCFLFLISKLIWAQWGLLATIAAYVFFPVTVIVAPWVAGIIFGQWLPLLFAQAIPLAVSFGFVALRRLT